MKMLIDLNDWHALNAAVSRAAAMNDDPRYEPAIRRATEVLVAAQIRGNQPIGENPYWPKEEVAA